MDQSFLSSGKSVALDEKEIAHSDLTNFRRIPQNVIVVASVGGALPQLEPFPNLNSGHSGPFCPSRPKSCALFYVSYTRQHFLQTSDRNSQAPKCSHVPQHLTNGTVPNIEPAFYEGQGIIFSTSQLLNLSFHPALDLRGTWWMF